MPDYTDDTPTKGGPITISKETEMRLAAAISNASNESLDSAKEKFAQVSDDNLFNLEINTVALGRAVNHQAFLDNLFSRDRDKVIRQLRRIEITDPAEQEEIVRALDLISPNLARLTAKSISLDMAKHETSGDHEDHAEEASSHNY